MRKFTKSLFNFSYKIIKANFTKKIPLVLASLILITIFSGTSFAQSCGGSLGSAIFTENFGTPGACYSNTAMTGTDYTFQGSAGTKNPADGEYVIWCNSTANPGWALWHSTFADHTTGNGSGYMAIFNASSSTGTAGEFFKKTVTGLCQNTNYTVSIWVANMADSDNDPSACGGGAAILPDVRYYAYKTGTTTVLGSLTTGTIIPESSNFTWINKLFTFNTGTETSVDLSIQNFSSSGCGNDVAFDDITFQPCGPVLTNAASPSASVTAGTSVTFNGTISAGYTTPQYQWQLSTDGGTTFTNIAGATSINYAFGSTVIGDNSKQFRLLSSESGNIANSSCRINSNAVTLTVTTPTPIALNSLKALFTSEDVVELLWKSDGKGSCQFDIYGSYDGVNYVLLNTLNCQPNTELYSYRHEFVGNSSMNYFKVKEYSITSDYNSWSNIVYADSHKYITNKIVLFPNPVNTNSVLTIYVTKNAINKIEIFDVNGKLINTIQANDESMISLNIGDLSKGFYFVKIETTDGILHEKLIVE